MSTTFVHPDIDVPKKLPDLYEVSIAQLQDGLSRKDFTSVDLVKAYLARIEEVNLKGPSLRCVYEVNPSAIDQAAKLDEKRAETDFVLPSQLYGIPILLKDNIATISSEGMNTTAGSHALLGSVVPFDAGVVTKLRIGGAIILGKASLTEWAHARDKGMPSGWSGIGGQTTNAYYPKADPSGSSAGSGVATSIGLAAAALGTETHGSLIWPSACNNLVGIKPTVGLTSRAGVVPITPSQDTIGPMTRSLADAAAVLSVIAGEDKDDIATRDHPSPLPDYTNALNRDGLSGKRIGVPRLRQEVSPITSSIMVAFEDALRTMGALGAVIVDPADLPSTEELIGSKKEGDMFVADMKTGFKAYFDSLAGNPSGVRTMADLVKFNNDHPELEGGVGQRTLINAEASDGFSDEDRAYLREIGGTRGIDATLKEHNLDALVFPVAGLADTIGAAAVAGYPIITVPLGFLPNDTPAKLKKTLYYPAPGLPYGLAFTGTAWSEFQLIEIAFAYEQESKTRLKRLAYPQAIPRTQLRDVMGG